MRARDLRSILLFQSQFCLFAWPEGCRRGLRVCQGCRTEKF
jgi:hypothetical protein